MNPAVQQWAWTAGQVALKTALFPFTHVLFYIVLSLWLVLKHTVIVPLLLILRIALFGLVYLPLTPVLTVADVEYDETTSVESLIWQLAVHLAPHVAFFLIHLLHYLIITGVVVGWFTGLNMSVVLKVLTPPPVEEKIQEEIDLTRARMEELKRQLPPKVESTLREAMKPKRESKDEEVKEEARESPKIKTEQPESALASPPEGPAQLTVADIVQNRPRVLLQKGKVDFSGNGTELAYEDDDGYNYMSYRGNGNGNGNGDEGSSWSEEIEAERALQVPTIEEESEESSEEMAAGESGAKAISFSKQALEQALGQALGQAPEQSESVTAGSKGDSPGDSRQDSGETGPGVGGETLSPVSQFAALSERGEASTPATEVDERKA